MLWFVQRFLLRRSKQPEEFQDFQTNPENKARGEPGGWGKGSARTVGVGGALGLRRWVSTLSLGGPVCPARCGTVRSHGGLSRPCGGDQVRPSWRIPLCQMQALRLERTGPSPKRRDAKCPAVSLAAPCGFFSPPPAAAGGWAGNGQSGPRSPLLCPHLGAEGQGQPLGRGWGQGGPDQGLSSRVLASRCCPSSPRSVLGLRSLFSLCRRAAWPDVASGDVSIAPVIAEKAKQTASLFGLRPTKTIRSVCQKTH